jgi:hypothetical protein
MIIMPASDVRLGRLTTTSARFETAPDTVRPEWIVCHSAVRSVAGGVVICPQGAFAPWARCLSCRHLEVAEDDRDPERSCSTEPAATALEDRIQPPEASWAALAVELL